MSKSIVLAEKPSVGKDLAHALGCGQKGNGFFEGNKYIVTWALGHLVTLADPEDYDQRYKSWNLEDLPMLPETLKLEVIGKTAKQFNTVKAQLARPDVSEIIIATDAGREGELVARWILKKARVSKPVKRLWISSVTEKAIKEGFARLKPGKDYEKLYQAAEARAEADWLVGINATRALTVKHNAQLSCGRVQTPTVAIIAWRENEIKNFQPQPFYQITAGTGQASFAWRDAKTKETRSFDREFCEKLLKGLAGCSLQITNVETIVKKSFAPPLYDLTTLQQQASQKFGFSPKETLSIAQNLYERHKVLTYPRTDSRYLSSDILGTIKERLEALKTGAYGRQAAKILNSPIRGGSHFVNDGKVTDHHAIIPTEQFVPLSSFTDRERKIYDLVVKRFLAVLYPPFEYEQITAAAKIGAADFFAKGRRVLRKGFQEVEDISQDSETGADVESADEAGFCRENLPAFKQGDFLPVKNLDLSTGKTKPPPPFTEGSLIGAMENPVKYIGDAGVSQSLKKTLKETGGLGTVATRADIIEKLFSSFFIEKKGQDLYVTSKGRQLLELVPPELKSPALTGEWEMKLSAIAKGDLPKEVFVREMRNYAKEAVSAIKTSPAKFKHDNLTRDKCPECGKYMLKVNGKRGQMLICQDRECGFRKNTSVITNARCPNCHKKLELKGQGANKTFSCACGHRESLSAFEARKKDTGDKASRADLSQYLKKNPNAAGAPLNTALADALAALKGGGEMNMNNVRPAVFFDRDGVLNVDKGYVYKIEDFVWAPGAVEAIRLLNEREWLVFVFTNQSGVARGYYSEGDIKNLHNYMAGQLKEHQAKIDAFYYCPHFDGPEAKTEKYRLKCRCRKPSPGMIEQAFAEWPGIDRDMSFVVGDRQTDIEAGQAAGIRGYLFAGGDLAGFIRKIIL